MDFKFQNKKKLDLFHAVKLVYIVKVGAKYEY